MDAEVRLKLSNIIGLFVLKSEAPTAMKPLEGTEAGTCVRLNNSLPFSLPDVTWITKIKIRTIQLHCEC